MLDPLLSDHQVEKITGRARSTLQKDRVAGTGIPFVRIGRLVRYRQSAVAAYLDALPSRRSTSEADAACAELSELKTRTIKGEHLGKASVVSSIAPVTEKKPTKNCRGPLPWQGDSDLDDEIPDHLR